MNVSQFNSLPLDQRAKLVWERGRLLSIRHSKRCSAVLYHTGEFYVEVWFSPSKDFIVTVHGFEGTRCLEPYLGLIDLEKLME